MNPRVVMLEVAARGLYWVILAASVWVLLRGHNEPGGGFIGALVAVSATVLWAVARSPGDAARRLPLGSPRVLGAAGVLLGALSGLPGVLAGGTFLTHLWWTLDLGITEVKLSTVLLFDLGVYLGVWGALAGYAIALLEVDPGAGRETRP
ncbi:MAG: hypothetical protein MUC71_07395 [Steroidobacteraceae bacterium]|nr:hypothetical protein [Steroidobacteraceae bacterium]